MSEIADALKKIKKKSENAGQAKASYKKFNLPSINTNLVYFIILLFFGVLSFFYYTNIQKTTDKVSSFDYPSAEKLQAKYSNELNKYDSKMNEKGVQEFYLALLTENHKKAKDIAYNADNKKLTAVYTFFTGNINESQQICEQILAENPENTEILNILSMIHYKRNNFDEAMHYQGRIKNDNYKTLLNKAIIYEQKNSYIQALDFYSKSLTTIKESNKKSGENFLLRTLKRKIYLLSREI